MGLRILFLLHSMVAETSTALNAVYSRSGDQIAHPLTEDDKMKY